MAPALHLRLLGNFLLCSDEKPVLSITSPRLQSLLAYLAIHRAAPQDRSHVAFALWPDSTEARAHASLRKLLHQLRQVFPDIDTILYTDHQCLYWQPGAGAQCTIDLQELEEAVLQAERAERAQDFPALRRALEQVVQIYHGDLLPGCYDEWILPERERVRQLFFRTIERLLILLEEMRAYGEAIEVAKRLLQHDPLHEPTYRRLMRLYALQGDTVTALRLYHSCATILERELSTEPAEATLQTYQALLHVQIQPGPAPANELVGRGQEWRQLQAVWRKSEAGSAQFLLISGEAGIGKTRLAEEMLSWAARQGIPGASAHCYASEGHLAYAPIAAWLKTELIRRELPKLNAVWLSEVARLLPDLFIQHPELPHPTSMTENWQQQSFFEALVHAIIDPHRALLLLIDDLQWCDQETLHWLQYLLRFAAHARLLVMATIRNEDLLHDHPVAPFLGALQRQNLLTELSLTPLSTTETNTLAEQLAQHPLEPAQANSLYAETEGNPLFIVEMVRAGVLEEEGKAIKHGQHAHSSAHLPPTVQSVLATRIAQLSPPTQEIAKVAAVIGREFSFAVLIEASSETEERVVQALDELWQRRMLREQGKEQVYDFSHTKIREQVYTSLSPMYRRHLHKRVAEALTALFKNNLQPLRGQLASHYELAGLPAQAILNYQQAATIASHMYAHMEVLHALERAVSLLEAQTTEGRQIDIPWQTAAQIYEELGDVLAELGQYGEARKALLQSNTFLPQEMPLWQARLKRKVANSWNHTSTNPHDAVNTQARQIFQEAEKILSERADPGDPAWRQEWIELHFAQILPIRGSGEEVNIIIEKLRSIIEPYGTQEQRERLIFALAIRNLMHDHYVVSEKRIEEIRKIATILEQSQDKSRQVIGHLALGVPLLWAGYLDEAEEHFTITLNMGRKADVAWLRIRSLTFLSFLFRFRGQRERVRQMLTEAETIGAAHSSSVFVGQRAWLAWCDGNVEEAERYARLSLEHMQDQQLPGNPFQWVGRWPLIALLLSQHRYAEAIGEIRLLLDPSQQPPPSPLKERLIALMAAWENDQLEQNCTLLQETLSLTKQMGYL